MTSRPVHRGEGGKGWHYPAYQVVNLNSDISENVVNDIKEADIPLFSII